MANDVLRIRCYNVLFGDALLITVPDRDETGDVTERHLLIDVGNVLAGEGGRDEVFVPILEDVLEITGGKPVDLYVMTHEHMDHVQGLPSGAKQGVIVKAQHVWMTGSAAPDYYEQHPEAKKKHRLAMRAFASLERQLALAPEKDQTRFSARMFNNNPRKTADCVKHIREDMCKPENVHFVHRGYDLKDAHNFHETKFEIWGPEEDTSVYYGRFKPLALGLAGSPEGDDATPPARLTRPAPPAGVDVGAFNNLLDLRESGSYENLMAIDKAKNNTSVVFALEWRGWRLLFAGDAEVRSWKTMFKHNVIKPVHFLKVSHHGSHNGTPSGDILEMLLPADHEDAEHRYALISTCDNTYPSVPDTPTTDELAARCDILDTRLIDEGDSWDIELEG